MAEAHKDFSDGVLECVDDINRLLPQLTDRFHLMVVVSALAQQVGDGLQVLLRRRLCDAALAHRLLRHIEDLAFGVGPRAGGGT